MTLLGHTVVNRQDVHLDAARRCQVRRRGRVPV